MNYVQRKQFHEFATAWGYPATDDEEGGGVRLYLANGSLAFYIGYVPEFWDLDAEGESQRDEDDHPFEGSVTYTLSTEELEILGNDWLLYWGNTVDIEAFGESIDEVLEKLQAYYAKFAKAKSKGWKKFKKYLESSDFGDEEFLRYT